MASTPSRSYGAFNKAIEEEQSPLLQVSSSSSSTQNRSNTNIRRKASSSAAASASSPIFNQQPPPPMTSSSRNNNSNNSKNDKNDGSILVHRFLILLALVGVVCIGVYYQNRMTDLTVALQQEHDTIEQLQTTLSQHEQVISRFNTSVTNQDVILRLNRLEVNLQNTTILLQHELKMVSANVSQRLNETLLLLSNTVKNAEDEITKQVATVKLDLDDYMHTTQDQFSMENSFMVYQLAGTFTLLSCLISMWHITAHLRRMNQPNIQRKILAILWMSPIYAVTSWFSLVFHSAEGYLAIIKDGYEAYIIYQFLSFLIAVLGKGDRNEVVDLLAKRAHHLTPPFSICFWRKQHHHSYDQDDRALANEILLQCQFFALQFVFFRPLTTTAMVVLDKMHYYGPNNSGGGEGGSNNMMDYQSPQAYITIIQNLSIFIAFTGLLKFYHAVDKDLAWCRPFAKFCCIKGVVFMTFWQGLAISILAQMTDVGIKPSTTSGAHDVHAMASQQAEWAKSAQNFLICLEMLLFSIAHFYCFPTEEWQEGYKIKHSQGQFGDTIALGDFLADIKLIVQNGGAKKRRRKSHQPQRPAAGNDNDDDTEAIQDDGDHDQHSNSSNNNNHHDVENPRRSPLPPQTPPPLLAEPPPQEDQVLIYKNNATGATTAARYKGSFGDMDDMDDDQRYVAMQLEKSLGVDLASQDPEIAEATKRLLASHVLDPAFFDMATTAASSSSLSNSGRGLLTDEMRQFLRENSLEDAYSDDDEDYDYVGVGDEHELDASIVDSFSEGSEDDEEDDDEEQQQEDTNVEAGLQNRNGDNKDDDDDDDNNKGVCAKQLFNESGATAAGAAAVNDVNSPSANEGTNDGDKKQHPGDCSLEGSEDGKDKNMGNALEQKETTRMDAGSARANDTPAAAKEDQESDPNFHAHARDTETPPPTNTSHRPGPIPSTMTSPNGTTSFSLRPSIFTTVASLADKETEEKKEKCNNHEQYYT